MLEVIFILCFLIIVLLLLIQIKLRRELRDARTDTAQYKRWGEFGLGIYRIIINESNYLKRQINGDGFSDTKDCKIFYRVGRFNKYESGLYLIKIGDFIRSWERSI